MARSSCWWVRARCEEKFGRYESDMRSVRRVDPYNGREIFESRELRIAFQRFAI